MTQLSHTPKAGEKTFSVGKVDCKASDKLCDAFFLADNYLPVFYHVTSYSGAHPVELRQIPWNMNVTLEEQSGYYAGLLAGEEKKWLEIKPWTGVFNPIDGVLKDVAPFLGLALKHYERLPQWAVMLGISLIGRQIS